MRVVLSGSGTQKLRKKNRIDIDGDNGAYVIAEYEGKTLELEREHVWGNPQI